MRYRLGLKVARSDVACSFCTQSFDEYGDHAACCRRNSDIIVRHNRLRNLVCRFAEEGLLSPVLEKRFLLGEASGRRPGDVTIPCWKNSKGLAVDVAVTSTFSTRNLTLDSPTPMGWSSTRSTTRASRALLEKEVAALSFFRQLFRFAARQQNTKLCVYAGRAWARVACNIQTSVAQAILHRAPTGGHSERGDVASRQALEPSSPELAQDAEGKEGGGEGEEVFSLFSLFSFFCFCSSSFRSGG